MTDTNTAMATMPAEPECVDTTKPPYYYPKEGLDARIIHELTLYAS